MRVKPFSELVSDKKEQNQEPLKPFVDRAYGGKQLHESEKSIESTCRKEIPQENRNIFHKTLHFLGSVSGVITLVAAFIFVAIFVDTIQTIETLIRSHSLLDALYLFALTLLLSSLSILSYRNYREIKSLKNAKKVQDFFAKQKITPTKELIPATLDLLSIYAKTPNEKLQTHAALLESRISSSHEYKEIYKELDEEVISQIDREAQAKIKAASLQAAISTAISPLALLDAAIVLWRTLRLTKEIALLYGYKPGWLSSITLLKQGAFNIFFAGATELALEYTNELAENSILSKLSTSAAQGLSNGILLARVGYGVMQACRPLPMRIKRESFTKGIYHSLKESILSSKKRES